MAELKTPPLRRIASGRGRLSVAGRPSAANALAACLWRKAARCRGIAGSATYGNPISCMPARAPFLGRSPGLVFGKKPSKTNSSTSARLNVVVSVDPSKRLPSPAMAIFVSAGAFSRKSFSFASRAAFAVFCGGALLLGVAGLSVVCHGRSSAKAVRNAIAMTYRFATSDFIHRVEREIAAAAMS